LRENGHKMRRNEVGFKVLVMEVLKEKMEVEREGSSKKKMIWEKLKGHHDQNP